MKTLAAVLLLLSFVYAQQPPTTAPAQIEALKQCSFIAGEWMGDGWMMFGPKDRRTFTETESVQPKLDGLVVLIEGHGTSPDGRTIHQALATSHTIRNPSSTLSAATTVRDTILKPTPRAPTTRSSGR